MRLAKLLQEALQQQGMQIDDNTCELMVRYIKANAHDERSCSDCVDGENEGGCLKCFGEKNVINIFDMKYFTPKDSNQQKDGNQ